MASTKFTVELNGVALTPELQAEISRDINRAVAKKIAASDFNAKRLIAPGTLGIIDLINGGRIERMKQMTNLATIMDSLKLNPKEVMGITTR